MSNQDETNDIVSAIKKNRHYAIYGAQVVAYGIYTALRSVYGLIPDCFIVSAAENNPAEIEGVKVRTLSEYRGEPGTESGTEPTLILVAVTELLQDEICPALDSAGLNNYIRIGANEEHLLMRAYFDSIGKFPALDVPSLDAPTLDVTIDYTDYVVRHHSNKHLKQKPTLQDWETEIQAGAADTDIRLTDITDNTGDNISHKNPQYAEATAIYYVWKNTAHTWKGICHYRRRLSVNKTQLSTLNSESTDAILPLPYICYPDTLSHFNRFVSRDIINTLLTSLRTIHPDGYDKYIEVLNGQYFYPYNLFAARREVFDNCCAWAFPVLKQMEKNGADIPEITATRALAYSSEQLTSLYFLSNADSLNIRHVEKKIYTM